MEHLPDFKADNEMLTTICSIADGLLIINLPQQDGHNFISFQNALSIWCKSY